MCSTMTRTCKVLSKVISKVRPAATVVNLHEDISLIRGWPRLDGSRRRLCTSQEEDKHVPYSGKTLAQTKKEQCWRYDPTIKYEALRRYAVPRYAYDSSYWSDSSDCEVENVYMAGEEGYLALKEAQTEKEKIFGLALKEAQTLKEKIFGVTKEELVGAEEELVGAEEEQLFCHDPSIEYKPLKRYIVPRFAFSDTSSTDWSESTDSESETEAMAEEATRIKEKIRAEQLFCNDLAKSPSTDFQNDRNQTKMEGCPVYDFFACIWKRGRDL